MKKKLPPIQSEKKLIVKEISKGVYINLSRITSEQKDFETEIEKSFRELNESYTPDRDKKDTSEIEK